MFSLRKLRAKPCSPPQPRQLKSKGDGVLLISCRVKVNYSLDICSKKECSLWGFDFPSACSLLKARSFGLSLDTVSLSALMFAILRHKVMGWQRLSVSLPRIKSQPREARFPSPLQSIKRPRNISDPAVNLNARYLVALFIHIGDHRM